MKLHIGLLLMLVNLIALAGCSSSGHTPGLDELGRTQPTAVEQNQAKVDAATTY
jgi:hypothetical protein